MATKEAFGLQLITVIKQEIVTPHIVGGERPKFGKWNSTFESEDYGGD